MTVVAVHGKLSCAIKLRCFASGFERISVVNIRLVAIAEGNHAYPSRTRPLSPPAPMVLGSGDPGRVGRCQADYYIPHSSIAQSVERSAVNRVVTGSSPVRGAILERCPSWSKEHDWKSCRRPQASRGFESLSLRHIKYLMWPVGQVVKTPPFHGGNTGSNPVRVTISQ